MSVVLTPGVMDDMRVTQDAPEDRVLPGGLGTSLRLAVHPGALLMMMTRY